MSNVVERMKALIQTRNEKNADTIPTEGVKSDISVESTTVVNNDPLVVKKLEIRRKKKTQQLKSFGITALDTEFALERSATVEVQSQEQTATKNKPESVPIMLASDSKLRQSIQIMFYRTKINRKRFNDVYSMLRDESKSDEEIISNMLGMSGKKFNARDEKIREFVAKARQKIREQFNETVVEESIVPSVTETDRSTSMILPMNCLEFLSRIYHSVPENMRDKFFTYIWTRSNSNENKRTNSFSLANISELIHVAKNINEQERNVSFSMGLLDHAIGTYQRAKDIDIVAIPCLWCDIDIASEVHGQSQKLAPNLETAISFLPKELYPSIIVDSGFGIHAYWIFTELLSTKTDEEKFRAKKLLTQLQSIIRHNADGCFIDKTADLSRMLRLPDTINWKIGNKKDAPICHVIEVSDERYSIDGLESMLSELAEKLIPKTENPREISASQREFVERNYSTKIAETQCSNASVREIIDGSRDLSLIYQNCPVIRAVVNNPQNLSHDIAKLVFPSLLKFKNKPIDGGRELCLEICKQWLGERFNPDLTSRQLAGIAELNNSCDSIRALGLPCDYMQCEIYKRGGRCPAAILGNRFSNDLGETIGAVFHDAPEEIRDLIIPTGFDVSESHVEDCRGKYSKIIINVPVVVSKEIIQAGTDYPRYYEIKRYRNGRWSSCRVDPVTLMDSKSATSILSRAGINIPSRRAGYATEYFADFIEQNSDRIPSIEIYTKLGWIGDRFILPTLNDGSYYIEESETVKKIKRAGSYQTSLELFKESVKYRYIRLLVDLNLAAPLLEIIGCRNFVAALICKSHAGKSTAMVLANSMWGSPELMGSFNATENAIEELAADRNSLPTNINEWQLTKAHNREETANQIIHRFEDGKGKARLNRDGSKKPIRSWRGILLITAEENVTSDNVSQGVKTRCWEILADTIVDDQALCKKIHDLIKRNYGHIGPEFIRRLQDEFRDDPQHEKIREEFNIFFQKARDAKSQRIIASYAEYVAVVACAHLRFNIWFLGMNEADALNDTLEFIQREAEALPTETAMLDTERAKESIIDWIHAYEAHFCRLKPNGYTDDAPIKDPYYGFIDGDGANIIPSELKKALKDRGFNPSKIIREWAQAGDIITSGDKDRFTCKKTDLKSGKRLNVIVLKISTDDQDIDPNSIPF